MSIKAAMLAHYYQTRADFPDDAFSPQQRAMRDRLINAGLVQIIPRLNPLTYHVRIAIQDWGRQ